MTNLLILTPTSLPFNTLKPPPKLKIGYLIAKVDTYIPHPLYCHNCQKFGHPESWCTREYVQNVERMVLTTQNPPLNDINMLTAMEITLLTLDSMQHGKEKKKS